MNPAKKFLKKLPAMLAVTLGFVLGTVTTWTGGLFGGAQQQVQSTNHTIAKSIALGIPRASADAPAANDEGGCAWSCSDGGMTGGFCGGGSGCACGCGNCACACSCTGSDGGSQGGEG